MGSQERPCAFDTGSFPERSWYTGWPWFVPPLTTLYNVLDGYDRWTK
jgi:hypothetical protein